MKFKAHIKILLILCIALSCKQKEKSIVFSNKECIDNIIRLDDSLGTVRNHECEKITLSQTITNYTNSLNNLDFEGCSENFEAAFKKHENAWRDLQKITNSHSDLRGELHDLFNQIQASKDSVEFKSLSKNIWSTWTEIENEIKK